MRLIDADTLLETINKTDEIWFAYELKNLIINAPTVQREVPDEMPKLGGGIYKHENLGELYDRLQVHQYAVNHCETITAMLSNKNTVQREGWVSVEDRLPEDNAYIMVWSKTISMPDIARFVKHKEIYESVVVDWDAAEITHWQPLPAAPKE